MFESKLNRAFLGDDYPIKMVGFVRGQKAFACFGGPKIAFFRKTGFYPPKMTILV